MLSTESSKWITQPIHFTVSNTECNLQVSSLILMCPYSLWNLMLGREFTCKWQTHGFVSNKYRRLPSNNNSQRKYTLQFLVFSPHTAFSFPCVTRSEHALAFFTHSVFSGWSCVVVSELTTTVLFRTTFTQTIKLYLLLNIQRVAKHWIPLRKFYLYVQKWNKKKIQYIIAWFKISCQTDMKFT